MSVSCWMTLFCCQYSGKVWAVDHAVTFPGPHPQFTASTNYCAYILSTLSSALQNPCPSAFCGAIFTEQVGSRHHPLFTAIEGGFLICYSDWTVTAHTVCVFMCNLAVDVASHFLRASVSRPPPPQCCASCLSDCITFVARGSENVGSNWALFRLFGELLVESVTPAWAVVRSTLRPDD